MDMATELRKSMASKQLTAAQVGALIGRTRVTVSRYRCGAPIPLEIAQELHRQELLPAAVLLGTEREAA